MASSLDARLAALERSRGLENCDPGDPEAARESVRLKLAELLAKAGPLQATDPTGAAVAMRQFREALQERIEVDG